MDKKEVIVTNGNTPQTVIDYAIQKGATVQELEQLLTLKERYEANEARKAYNAAMAEFKANPPKIKRDKQVVIQHKNGPGQTRYSHAKLCSAVETITPELSKHGLSASWRTKQNGKIVVGCRISHKLGHFEEIELSADADTSGSKNPIQAIGSTISYLQRYTLLSILGLAAEDMDDDGQAAGSKAEIITEAQANTIADLIAEKNVNVDKFCKAFGIGDIKELPASKYKQAEIALVAKKSGKTGGKQDVDKFQ